MKVAATAAAVALGIFFKKAFDEATQAQEVNQKFAVTFREVSKESKAAAKNLADSFGLAKTEAKELLANTGDLLSGFGFTGAEALALSDKVNQLAADTASFSNIEGGTARASEALTKALLGERESVKALGIVISEAAVKEEIRRLGLQDATGDALLRAKAEATYNIAVRQSTNAIGDFNRSQNSTANVIRRVEALMKDQRIEVGNELTPAITELGITFLETSKDGGVIQSALISMAKVAAFATRIVTSLIETLNIWSAEAIAPIIQMRQDELAEKTKQFNEDVKNSAFKSIKNINAETLAGQLLLKQKESLVEEGRELNRLGQKNIDQLTGSADRQEELLNKMLGGKDAIDETVDKREKEKKLLQDQLALEKKKNKANKDGNDEKEKSLEIQDKVNIGLEASIDILGGFISLLSALNENRLNDIDTQEQRALEVAGVEEETAIEKAERELADAEEAGDAALIKEKKDAVEREKIFAEFDKKRAKAEYEGALLVWDLQVAQSISSGALAISNALAAGSLFGPVTAGIFVGIASAAALLNTAAVVASKPEPPKFAHGGIIQGSTSGTAIIAGENNQDEGIFNQAQMQRLLSIADGQGGGGGFQRVAPISKDLLFDELLTASQNGELFISKGAVI